MTDQPINGFNLGFMIGIGAVLATLAMLADMSRAPSPRRTMVACSDVIKPESTISKQQFAQFLTIPERYQKQQVRLVVRDPYCRLPSLEVRSGVTAEREAYPFAFDSSKQLVILYEGDEYAGYTIGSR
ncbi:MAG: hypothetical protein NZ772_05185 [Cyanobacteria bacterium]|nr:hypothetical protein [Cyanobacteriota bacterium]MDW8200882.1 hypothetical protein [Cyanobacteriota bacterium SKYGB_h_bin112]